MSLTAGTILRETFETVKAIRRQIALGLILLALPMVLFVALYGIARHSLFTQAPAFMTSSILLSLFYCFYGVVIIFALQAVALQSRSGVHPALRTAIVSSLRRVGPLLRASMLGGFAVWLGLLCLVFPGLILAAGLAVSGPLVLFEDADPVDAMKGSWELTRGQRWSILAAFSVSAAGFLAVHLVFVGSLILADANSAKLSGVAIVAIVLAVLIHFLAVALWLTMTQVMRTVAYLHLRRELEGVNA